MVLHLSLALLRFRLLRHGGRAASLLDLGETFADLCLELSMLHEPLEHPLVVRDVFEGQALLGLSFGQPFKQVLEFLTRRDAFEDVPEGFSVRG